MVDGNGRRNGGVGRTLGTTNEAELPALAIDARQGLVISSNARFAGTFGWTRAMLEGRTYRDLVGGERRREVRELLSILSFGGSRPPLKLPLRDSEGRMRETTWVGIPNVVGEPTDPVVVITRPTGARVGKPIGPPASLVERDDLGRIPPRERVLDRRGAAEKSRSLWRD